MSTAVADELTQEAEALGMYQSSNSIGYSIEKGIPLPKKGNELQLVAATLAQMERGDSVFIPQSRYRAAATWHVVANLTGRKVATRTVDGGVRIWRVK